MKLRCKWRRRAARPFGRRRSLLDDESGLTELIGYMTMFLSLAAMLGISMVAFQNASEASERRVIELRAESIVQRITTAAVDLSLIASAHGAENVVFEQIMEFPDTLEGRSYFIQFVSNATTDPAFAQVVVPSLDYSTSATIFATTGPVEYDVCESGVFGGAIKLGFLHWTHPPAQPDPDSGDCIKLVSKNDPLDADPASLS